MARYLVLSSTGLVVNVVLWDGQPGWGPPSNHTTLLDDNRRGNIGQSYASSNDTFIDPPAPPAPTTGKLDRLIEILSARIVSTSTAILTPAHVADLAGR